MSRSTNMKLKTIQRVSLLSLKLFGPMRKELQGKEVEGFFMSDWKMGWWVFFCPPTWLPQHNCMEINS